MVTNHLDSNTKYLKVLFYYNFINNIMDEEEDVMLVTELNLFTISTITLPKSEILAMMVVDAIISTNAKNQYCCKN